MILIISVFVFIKETRCQLAQFSYVIYRGGSRISQTRGPTSIRGGDAKFARKLFGNKRNCMGGGVPGIPTLGSANELELMLSSVHSEISSNSYHRSDGGPTYYWTKFLLETALKLKKLDREGVTSTQWIRHY